MLVPGMVGDDVLILVMIMIVVSSVQFFLCLGSLTGKFVSVYPSTHIALDR